LGRSAFPPRTPASPPLRPATTQPQVPREILRPAPAKNTSSGSKPTRPTDGSSGDRPLPSPSSDGPNLPLCPHPPWAPSGNRRNEPQHRTATYPSLHRSAPRNVVPRATDTDSTPADVLNYYCPERRRIRSLAMTHTPSAFSEFFRPYVMDLGSSAWSTNARARVAGSRSTYPPPRRGRPPRSCSQACRRASYEERRAATNGAIAIEYIEKPAPPATLDDHVAAVLDSPAACRKVLRQLRARHENGNSGTPSGAA